MPQTGLRNEFAYDVSAHPEFDRSGAMLIGYNVNSFNVPDIYSNVDRYRPYFVRVNHF